MKASYTQPGFQSRRDRAINKRFLSRLENLRAKLSARLFSNAPWTSAGGVILGSPTNRPSVVYRVYQQLNEICVACLWGGEGRRQGDSDMRSARIGMPLCTDLYRWVKRAPGQVWSQRLLPMRSTATPPPPSLPSAETRPRLVSQGG